MAWNKGLEVNKTVLIVSEYELCSRSGAAFERMKCYSKALPHKQFLCTNVDAMEVLPNEIKHHKETDNLTLILAPKKIESKIYRIFLKHFDIIRAYRFYRYIKSNFNKDETIILLYSSWLPLFFNAIIGLGKINKYDIVVEKNELETGIIKNINRPKGIEGLLFGMIYPFRLFSAWIIDKLTNWSPKVISISTQIHEKYRKSTHSELIPIIVDTKRFEGIDPLKPSVNLKVVYLGAITPNKDGLFEMTNALNKTGISDLKFTIDIIGSGNKRTVDALEEIIKKSGLDSIIKIKPPIGSESVPKTLSDYEMALLVRPSNEQTEYGFSTKLAEYLAAGLPVIYTSVGDNSRYLQDEIHGFCVKFPIIENFVITFQKAMQTNETELSKMKKHAKDLVERKFNCLLYTETLNKLFS